MSSKTWEYACSDKGVPTKYAITNGKHIISKVTVEGVVKYMLWSKDKPNCLGVFDSMDKAKGAI